MPARQRPRWLVPAAIAFAIATIAHFWYHGRKR